MSVSNRNKRDQPSGLAQLVRTFFQSYDESNPPDRIAALRQMPMGAVASFFLEQALWRGQRNVFGITLVEVKRGIDAAQGDATALRAQMARIQTDLAEVRALREQQQSTRH